MNIWQVMKWQERELYIMRMQKLQMMKHRNHKILKGHANMPFYFIIKKAGYLIMGQVDLHVHSTSSDGTYTPTELVNYAIEKGLDAFALTDHDTVDGIDEALAAAKGKPIRVIPRHRILYTLSES